MFPLSHVEPSAVEASGLCDKFVSVRGPLESCKVLLTGSGCYRRGLWLQLLHGQGPSHRVPSVQQAPCAASSAACLFPASPVSAHWLAHDHSGALAKPVPGSCFIWAWTRCRSCGWCAASFLQSFDRFWITFIRNRVLCRELITTDGSSAS